MDDYDSFNPDWGDDDFDDEWGGETPSDGLSDVINELLSVYGIETLGSIIINPEQVKDPSELRGTRFSSPAEVLLWMHEIGVLAFSNIVYYGDGEYGAAIPEKSP